MQAALDFGNQWGITAGREVIRVGRASACQSMTPDEALILAAWLVATAEPLSELAFDEVQREVNNSV